MTNLRLQCAVRFWSCAFVLLALAAPVGRAADQACPDPSPSPPATGVCSVTAGDVGRLLRGSVLLQDGIASNGSVMIDAAGAIVCAGRTFA